MKVASLKDKPIPKNVPEVVEEKEEAEDLGFRSGCIRVEDLGFRI